VVSDIPGASDMAVGDEHICVTATRSNELVLVDRRNCAIMRRMPVGEALYAVTCDRGWHRVYVGNAGDRTISVVDADGSGLARTEELGGLGHPPDLTLDPVRDRLYVSFALSPKHGAGAALEGSSETILTRLVGTQAHPLFGAYGIAADPLRVLVYVTTVDGILVLAGETLGVTGRTRRVGPVYACGMCVDPVRKKLYVADGRDGSLDVVG